MAVIVREAGKTLEGAQGDVREAVDFLRYYASEARRLFTAPVPLPGPTGERNTLTLSGRGAFACISPWNFPLAIFTGQVAAALAAGNTVLAKPAEQTPITAFLATRLLHEAGVPVRRAASVDGQRPSRRGARQGRAREGRLVHRLQRDGMVDPAGARRSPRGHRAVHRRDRRSQCDDRGFERTHRAGGARLRALGLRQRRPALLGGARAVPAGRLRRRYHRHAHRRHAGARHRRPLRLRDRHRAGDRRGIAGPARRPQNAHAARRPASSSIWSCPSIAARGLT